MTHRSHDAYLDLLPAYAAGALDAEERTALEAHLAAGCAACDRELAAWGRLVERLVDPVTPVAPSAATRARVLAAIRNEAGLPRRRQRRWRDSAAPFWLAAAASLAAVLFAGWAALGVGELRRELARTAAAGERTAARLALARSDLERAHTEIAWVSAALPIVASPAARAIVLAGLPAAPGAGGTAVVDPHTLTAVFYAHALPHPGAGKTYELWYLTAGGAVAAGVFDVDARGDGALRVEDLPDPAAVEAWAVTVEPAGGVLQPTGAMVLKG